MLGVADRLALLALTLGDLNYNNTRATPTAGHVRCPGANTAGATTATTTTAAGSGVGKAGRCRSGCTSVGCAKALAALSRTAGAVEDTFARDTAKGAGATGATSASRDWLRRCKRATASAG